MHGEPRSARQARVSVVIPVFNEAAVLPELRQRLCAALGGSDAGFEVVLVDDGSGDASPGMIDRMHEEDPRFKCVHFSRNFGHQAAVTAGLAFATGDVACVMDADLQDPPELLASLLSEWEKGSDVVYAIRRERKEHWTQVALYGLFYRILARLSTIPMPLDAGDFCLISRRALDELNRLPEKDRYVRGLRAWVGFRQTGVSYERDARRAGESKYSLMGLTRLGLNGIISFSDKPLVYVTVAGIGVSALAGLYGTYLVVTKLLFGGIITGYSSVMGAVLFLSGIQLLALGVVGLYLSKIFNEVKARPTYIVRETRGFETRAGRGSGPAGSA
jgi:dolichol-phosphate mannosyltransferase